MKRYERYGHCDHPTDGLGAASSFARLAAGFPPAPIRCDRPAIGNLAGYRFCAAHEPTDPRAFAFDRDPEDL